MPVCPDCNGAKGGQALVNYRDRGCVLEWADCSLCKGSGEVSDDTLARREEGRQRRADRIARHVSLHTEAETLGITVAELSAIEMGREYRQ